mmetsp:Transcript_41207/g.66824  ORF Transcript_41207/g.66824 Transcript_41207/m.66824 type:complete len:145 (+) Transcript_41207:55-489(+)
MSSCRYALGSPISRIRFLESDYIATGTYGDEEYNSVTLWKLRAPSIFIKLRSSFVGDVTEIMPIGSSDRFVVSSSLGSITVFHDRFFSFLPKQQLRKTSLKWNRSSQWCSPGRIDRACTLQAWTWTPRDRYIMLERMEVCGVSI